VQMLRAVSLDDGGLDCTPSLSHRRVCMKRRAPRSSGIGNMIDVAIIPFGFGHLHASVCFIFGKLLFISYSTVSDNIQVASRCE
jgi:hypothetical protein